MKKLKIGITHGDINGVGYELILKTFQMEEMATLCIPVIYGSPKIATYHRKAINSQTNFNVVESVDMVKENTVNMVNCFGEEEQKIELGQATESAGQAAFVALQVAMQDLTEGKIDALVTAPVNNSTIKTEEGNRFGGHTAYIESVTGNSGKALKIFVSGNLRIALVTDNIPVSEVASNINKEIIADKLVVLHNTLKRDFFIDNPRIAVLSLNPHACGAEEEEILKPVIDELFKRGVRCVGPYPADKFFGSQDYTHFDAILAMYYDQGAVAFKSIAQNEGVNYTAGLPVIRTAPAIGTNYEAAGKDITDEQAMRQAIYVAIDTARSRMKFDQERQNPLQKQYFEKRDDSYKLKLDQTTDEE